jgi:hypothetical protein
LLARPLADIGCLAALVPRRFELLPSADRSLGQPC